ncbi:VOC family protein [Yoonia sp. 208BN28-4]|uniref:VOC family protein n=1 Tax=Yoonia sp. 208BN28-4 TaxID=3126505 RepID=UPI0030A12584
MLTGICLGTNDLAKAGQFYDVVLGTIGMRCKYEEPHERGYAGNDGVVSVWIVSPFNEKPATYGNGTQVIFEAADKAAVDAFYAAALANGGTDEGPPGPRSYHPDYYGAYMRDHDGNKLHVAIPVTFPD